MILLQVLQTYNYANIFILRKDKRTLKKAIKGILIFAAILVGLSLVVSLLIRLPSVQNFAIQKTTSYISKNTDTQVSIGSFGWNMFDDLSLRHFYLGNKNGDTIIAVKSLFVDFDSWSILKSEVNVKSIILDKGVVNMEIDKEGKLNIASLFNSGKNEKKQNAPNKKSDSNWITVLKKVQLKNILIKIFDQNKFTTTRVNIPALNLDIDAINIKTKSASIRKVFIDRPAIIISQTDSSLKTPEDTASFYFMPEGWRVSWREFIIKDGKFGFDKLYLEEKKEQLDFNHLKVSKINLNAKGGDIDRELLSLELKTLTAEEKSGFVIKNISTNLKLSLTEFKLNKLRLITGNSFITDSVALNYSRFSDFKEFITKVRIDASLKNSFVSLKDFSYIAKGLQPYAHNKIFIDGNINGRISNLKAKNIVIRTAQNTLIKGDFSTSGLPDINETFLTLRITSLKTSIADIRKIAPNAKIPEDVNKVGNLNFYGKLDGFITDFVANGNLVTNIGNASSDINFKYNPKTNASFYKGDLNLDRFNLGKWFNDTTIGEASFSAVLNGKGLTLATLDTKIDGVVENIKFKNYNYKNLIVNGRVKNKSFEGDFSVTDPNIYLSFSGKADLSDTIPVYKFNAYIKNIALQELNLSKDDIRMKGTLNADFAGKTIDNLQGNILLNNLQLIRNNEIQLLNSLELSSKNLNNDQRILSLETDRAEAIVKGKFSLLTLPKILGSYFNKAIYQIADNKKYPPQIFTVDIRIYDSLPVLKILEPKLKLISNTFIKADINTEKETFELNGIVPILVYDNFKFKTTDLNSSIDKNRTTARITTDKVYSGDSLILDTIVLAVNDVANGYKLNIQVKDNKNFNKTNSNILIFPKSNSVDLQIRNSSIWLGGKEWLNTDNNNIHLGKKIIEIANLEFHSDSQRIVVQSYYKVDSLACIKTTMKETSLNGFMAIFNTKVKDIDATVNGMFQVEDIFNKPIFLGNMNFNNTKLGKVTLGNLTITSTLNSALNRIDLSGKLDGGQNNLAIKGYYNLDKQNQILNLTADIANGNLDFLNYKFFERYVKKVKGDFSGKLNISGPLKKLALEGKVILNDADVTVSYLNTRYSLRNEVIEVNKDGYFDIGEILLKDTKNNLAKGSGRIYHQNLKKFRLDLRVATDKMMFLNTTAKDNAVFYGQIFGKGVVTFSGVIPTVDIRAFATISDGTRVYIPINSNVEAAGYSFYKFTNRQNDSLREVGKRDQVRFAGVNFEVDVDVNTDGIIDIILDPISGDILSSQGAGNLKIQVLRTGEFNIYGLYEIDRGSYLFTLQNIINKRFALNKGGTIAFNGDVYKAQLNTDAVYEVRTSTYDLIFDPQQTEGLSAEVEARSKNRMLTRLLLKLKGSLERPDVSFDIQPQDPDPAIRTILENKMQIVKSTESELNKQVFGLLVMNRFLPTGTSVNPISNTSYISGSVTNTVSEFLSSQLSQYVSNFFETINVKEFDVKLNFRQYDQQSQSGAAQQLEQQAQFDTRRELQLALTKRFFNNRLSINVGGNLDFGDRNTYDASAGAYRNNPNTYVTGDFQIEYAITKSGNLRAKAYNRGDYDNFNQRNRNKTGIGLSFQQDFDNIYDLLRIKRKQNSNKEAEKNAAKKEEGISPVSK
jgi:hypothetical protein